MFDLLVDVGERLVDGTGAPNSSGVIPERWRKRKPSHTGSGIEAESPLASEQNREHLNLVRLSSEHVANRLGTGLPGGQPRSSVHLADYPPVVFSQLLKDYVSTGLWTHAPIVEFHPGGPFRALAQAVVSEGRNKKDGEALLGSH